MAVRKRCDNCWKTVESVYLRTKRSTPACMPPAQPSNATCSRLMSIHAICRASFRGVRGFGCIKRVLRQDLAAFEGGERATMRGTLRVRTTGNAPDLFVIKQYLSARSNRAAWGYDIGSESIRRAAAEHAMRTGEPTLSGSVTLLQDEQQPEGSCISCPCIKTGRPPNAGRTRSRARCLALHPIIAEEALRHVKTTAQWQTRF